MVVQLNPVTLKRLLICKLEPNVTHARWWPPVQNDIPFVKAMCAERMFGVEYRRNIINKVNLLALTYQSFLSCHGDESGDMQD